MKLKTTIFALSVVGLTTINGPASAASAFRTYSGVNCVPSSDYYSTPQYWSGIASNGRVRISCNAASIRCRSTLCRLEVSHADPAQMEEFLWIFTDMIAQSLPQMTMEQFNHDDGSVDTVLYLVREGHRLPQFD